MWNIIQVQASQRIFLEEIKLVYKMSKPTWRWPFLLNVILYHIIQNRCISVQKHYYWGIIKLQDYGKYIGCEILNNLYLDNETQYAKTKWLIEKDLHSQKSPQYWN